MPRMDVRHDDPAMYRLGRGMHRSRALTSSGMLATFAVCIALAGCAPKVGTPRWCEAMKQKPRGDWTANEALDFARHCVLGNGN